jgi:hypothetical protein
MYHLIVLIGTLQRDYNMTIIHKIWVKNTSTGISDLVEVDEQPALHPNIQRLQAYHIGDQLNFLFDDIEAGLFGEQAKTGKFYACVLAVKAQFPKA